MRDSTTLVRNERLKLRAAALDRLSTTCIAVGIAAPTSAWLLGNGSGLPRSAYIATCVTFGALALVLHVLAHLVLGGLE